MGIWDKIKDAFRRFMNGRHGADQLSVALLWVAIILNVIYMLTGVYIISLLATVVIVYAVFRMLSRDGGKRYAENARYMAFMAKCRTEAQQAKNRHANRKEYKYFRCPKCHSMLRMPRGIGEKTVTCGSCKHQFRKKA